ncbi:flagellar basal-body MS-ring/collar protein FliF [Clostridium vincentii]|uniref:Flagellar M-ring protein n=1 Tax=Clostridium vincentii TaxID=52704 RepID=A0A2T0B6D7_9CLOT|nr:flagellar basal-body MS-ring/collar protein FliF [Clostridium vincentii]PRR79435.1 Flagellar M-ring protein [Clostridium vincentii]
MKKLSDTFKKLWAKFKSFGRSIKIAIVVALIALLIAIISLFFFSSSNKYSVLYSGLDAADADIVIAKLTEDKIDKKVEGDSILVPTAMVDELRLQFASQLSDGSKGYELMDSGSSFGMTDEEFNIKKLRMIQGNIEKSIKSLEAIETVKVNITPAEDSVFVKDKQEGKAAVVLKLKAGKQITDENVKSIVAIVSASAENIPQNNVEVIDTNMNLLTKNLNSETGNTGVSAETIQSQKDLEKNSGDQYEAAIIKLLEPIVGKNKVSATVNVELDFDAKQTDETVIDPNKVIISQQTINSYNNANGGVTAQSPVDNNMTNTIDTTEEAGVTGSNEQKTNYETGNTTTTTISSAGKPKRITASVFIDGELDAGAQAEFENAISNAIGIDNNRGDLMSLTGMEFDTAIKDEAQAQIDAFNIEIAAADRNRIILWTAIGVLSLAGIIALLIIFIRRRKKDEDRVLDVVIDDKLTAKPIENFAPIDFEVSNEKLHMEKEIKDYAKEKPEEVVDIIKSWLSENER